jgi:hypothetical protein
MTDQNEHVATEQEDELYQAITAGDWDKVEVMRVSANESGDLEVIDQFAIDYTNAYAHYQADHEMPEEEREQATAEKVKTENNAVMEEEGEPVE